MADIKTARKPKLAFFQYRYDVKLPEFLLIHKREHVKCLAEFFDVTVIHEDCDYQQVCDEVQPDLALFESGVNHATCERLRIENIRACPEIPKLGLHNGDGFCNARAGFLSDMDHWGIETFFTISTTTAEHTPAIADSLFVWPNSIDTDVYRDYAGWKSIPVLFTGNKNNLYPWRQKILRTVTEHFPSLMCPHPGYDPKSAAAQVLQGERYARTINASFIVPACGTVAREIVRKHFEIPGCRACLLTERTAALELAGFVDMENCVFADESEVLDKLQHLFKNPEQLQRITDAGYELVHTRHTMKQRDQMLQWFNLRRGLRGDQKIVQTAVFRPLSIVDSASGERNVHVHSDGLHLGIFREADRLLWAGKYDAAEREYLRCLSYMRWMPELKLRVALTRLYKGDAKTAHSRVAELLEFILVHYKALDPDPVEWAYYIIALLCLGKQTSAFKAAGQYPWLRHVELDRARWLADALKTGRRVMPLPAERGQPRKSIHQMSARSLDEWVAQVCLMLKACGQTGLVQTLTAGSVTVGPPDAAPAVASEDSTAPREPFQRTVTVLRRRYGYSRLLSKLRDAIGERLHRLEARYGYFLPYHLSKMRDDEFFQEVRRLLREQDVRHALVIGAVSGAGSTEALLAGVAENENRPTVFCVNGATRRFRQLQRRTSPGVECRGLPFDLSAEQFSQAIERAVREARQAKQIDAFDVVLIDGSNITHEFAVAEELRRELHGARFVLLDDISGFNNYENHDRLIKDANVVLVGCNPGLRNGYAVFRRHSGGADRGSAVWAPG